MIKTFGTHNYYVYILTNKNRTVLYIGFTNDLKARLYYHSHPEANSIHFTHRYRCKYLVYYEHYSQVDIAIDREKQIKKWRREKKDQLIDEFNPSWSFLNDEI